MLLLLIRESIEKTNPSAVISSIVEESVAKITAVSDPTKVINSAIEKWSLNPKDACILCLNTAHRLNEQNNVSAARQILGEAARFAGGNILFCACIAQELGDIVEATRLLLKKTEEYTNDWYGINRFHSTEAACRLLFCNDSNVWRSELTSAIKRFEELGFVDVVERLQKWLAYESGFDNYLKLRIARMKAESFDMKEIRISQHRKSILSFLEGVNGNFRQNLRSGQRWFELSATGNDASWIQGSRAFFGAIESSLAAFKGRSESGQIIAETKQNFEKAAKYLRSQDPIALSIAFSALVNSLTSIDGKVIGDLSFSIEMMRARTPEVFEVRKRLSALRWGLIETRSRSLSVDRKEAGDLWENIARLAPLLDDIIDTDNRLSDNLFPFLMMSRDPFQITVEELLSVSDSDARGKILEDSVAEIIARSSGLKLIDVRHSNKYEEIDIVALVTRGSPMLEQWGPIILFECKNWQEKVGTEPVGFLYSKMVTKKNAIRLGVLVSPSGFTEGVDEQIARLPTCLILKFGPDELRTLLAGKKDVRDLLEEQIPLALLS